MTTYLVAVHLLLEVGPEPRPAINAALNEILSEAMRQNGGAQSPLIDWAVAGEDLAASIVSVDVSPTYEPDVTAFPDWPAARSPAPRQMRSPP
ncbi:hypothetical protein MIC97_20805 [Aquamicrobium sp. NLF2-7]|uniref:hypothetical protein n=1 Tax=Aquamicrobium sp. NLF2-7 TaxID=2918753 RepID=UPI001EFAD2E4|nr:hypothetical protein [Aquamicrobium sp. NLF2-7]MCG8273927.1 hypothetical protein [Aquamicrobium sp. NLF2-7]